MFDCGTEEKKGVRFRGLQPLAPDHRYRSKGRKLTQTRLAELLAVNPHFDTIVRIAELPGVSLDELAGRTAVAEEPAIRNHELHRLYGKVDQLSDEDQRALVIVLDSLVKRSRVSRVMAEA